MRSFLPEAMSLFMSFVIATENCTREARGVLIRDMRASL